MGLTVPVTYSAHAVVQRASLLGSFYSSMDAFRFLFLANSLPSKGCGVESTNVGVTKLQSMGSYDPITFIEIVMGESCLLTGGPSFPFEVIYSMTEFRLFSFLFRS